MAELKEESLLELDGMLIPLELNELTATELG